MESPKKMSASAKLSDYQSNNNETAQVFPVDFTAEAKAYCGLGAAIFVGGVVLSILVPRLLEIGLFMFLVGMFFFLVGYHGIGPKYLIFDLTKKKVFYYKSGCGGCCCKTIEEISTYICIDFRVQLYNR